MSYPVGDTIYPTPPPPPRQQAGSPPCSLCLGRDLLSLEENTPKQLSARTELDKRRLEEPVCHVLGMAAQLPWWNTW